MTKVLIVDDDRNYVSALASLVRKKGLEVDIARRCNVANKKVAMNEHDLVFVDMILPDGDGMDVIRNAPEAYTGHFYIMTGHPGLKPSAHILTGQAVDYLVKPVTTRKIDDVLGRYREEQIAKKRRLEKQKANNQNNKSGGIYSHPPSDIPITRGASQEIIGDSTPVRKILHDINRLGATRASVLVQGESGTGKELVARKIHLLGKRKGKLYGINCSAIPGEINGYDLFGDEKGSFTGPDKRHKGILERAHGGTLFLDEITAMPVDIQANLLRVLETGKLFLAGSRQTIDIDVRFIATTNSDPVEAVKAGKLREDLYFRLAEMTVIVPPLRSRGKDILMLARYFLDHLNEAYGDNKTLDDGGKFALVKYRWPGNVRELNHAVHRAFITSDNVLDFSEIENMTEQITNHNEHSGFLGSTIAGMEKQLILETLAHFDNNKPRAAEVLGISLKTLYNRLNRYNRPNHNKLNPPRAR